MSNERNINELLSAYFDGEVTAEERTRVEQFLEESVEARRELDQMNGLSELMSSLPAEPAPPELLPSVIRRAERETLLSIDTRTGTSTNGRKMWLTVVAGIAVAAAGVMLMTQFLPTEMGDFSQMIATDDSSSQQVLGREPVVVSFADDSPPSPAAADVADAVAAESAKSAGGFGRHNTAEMNDRRESPVASPAESSPVVAKLDERRKMKSMETRSRGSAEPSVDSMRLMARRGAQQVAAADAASSGRVASLNSQALKRASRGDVLQYFDSSGTKVTTYLVTVVDVKLAMNKLQLLLARNDIPPQQPLADNDKWTADGDLNVTANNKQTDEKEKLADEADERSDRLFAVYIETTPGRFASALKDLMNEEFFAVWSPQPPVDEVQIQVADLGRSYRSLFFQPGNEVELANSAPGKPAAAFKRDARSTAKTPAPRNTPSTSLAQPLAKQDSRSAQKKKAKSDRAENSDADKLRVGGNRFAARKPGELRSFQLQVQLAPRDANVERQRSAQIDQLRSPTGTRPPASPGKDHQAFDGGKQQVVADDHLSAVRVLFVFREAARQIPQR